MYRNETELFQISYETEEEVLDEKLKSVNTLFEAKNIFIFCEGKTEFNYFTGFNKYHNNSRIKIIPRYPRESTGLDDSGEGNDIHKLAEQVNISKNIENKITIHHNNKIKKYEIYSEDEINIVFDCDTNFRINSNGKSKYDEAKNIIETDNIQLYLSNYSFEIWILCHFEIPPNNLMNNSQIRIGAILPNRIKTMFIPEYDKNDKNIFDKLLIKQSTAITNAKKLIDAKINANIRIHSQISEPVSEIGILLNKLNSELI